jgi:hypothetical protein
VGGIRICNDEILQIIKEKKEPYLKYSNKNSLKIEQKHLWNCRTRD